MGQMTPEEEAVVPDVDVSEEPDDEPISEDEGRDPYEGQAEVVQETGTDEEVD